MKNIKKQKRTRIKEGVFGLSADSEMGKNYIKDLNFCLEFALENRKRMLIKTAQEILYYINGNRNFELNDSFINRNHNHAEINLEGLWIHRKRSNSCRKRYDGNYPWQYERWIIYSNWQRRYELYEF